MSDTIASLRAEIERLNKQPCECVVCSLCRGTGNYPIYDRTQPEEFDLEECDQCRNGIRETCERCLEIEELDEQVEEEQERRARVP
jgi:hypothetical protein